MNSHRGFKHLVFAAILVVGSSAHADIITPDFTSLGSVYQNSSGYLSATAGAGYTDVTSAFKSDVTAAFGYLNSQIHIAGWTETISIQLADLSGENAVGDSAVDSTDANGRPLTSTIRVDTGPLGIYVSSNPLDNSIFNMTSTSTLLGGSQVNVSQFGTAVAGSVADGLYDLVTLFIHEAEHSMGYSSGLDRFLNLVGQPDSTPGAPDRNLLVSASTSGLSSDFNIPIVAASSHIDGTYNNGIYNDTVVAEPGFGVAQRALPSAFELYGIGQIEGAMPGDITPINFVASVPEPSSFVLCGIAGVVGLVVARVRRKRAA